jgi:HK97 family phage portal protein
VSIAARAAKSIIWTFDPTVAPENDIIRERVLMDQVGGVWNGAGVTVDKAMGSVPVMAAIRVISENIASLPLQVFERLPNGGKRLALEHRLYGMLHDSPNPEMGSMVFRETMQTHIESWGNAYAEIEYDTDGLPLHLWPLRPNDMTVYRIDGELVYLYRTADGEEKRLKRRQVFHIPGLGYDGRIGYSPIHMARRGIALGIAVEEFAGRFYDHDARPGVAIMLGPEFDYDDDAKKRLAESFDATHAGLSNKHRTAVLDEGMGLEQIGWPPELGKLLSESQKWSVPTTSRIFNLSPHMLHDLERATFSNIEEQGLNVSTYQFRPRTVRWDQQIKLQLMQGDTRHFAEHNLDGFLKGKLEDRMKAYWQMFQMGAINPNEIRRKENMNPRDDEAGDSYYVPVNIESVSDEDEELPTELPPLQVVGGTSRSLKAISPAEQRRRLAEEFRPQFEKATADFVDFERRMILAEAERRFDTASKSSAPNLSIHLPDGLVDLKPLTERVESLSELPEQVDDIGAEIHSMQKAVSELRSQAKLPRRQRVVRDASGLITEVIAVE